MLGDVNRHTIGRPQCDGIAWPGINLDFLAVFVNNQLGVEGMIAQIVDFDPFQLAVHFCNYIEEQIMRQGPFRLNPL